MHQVRRQGEGGFTPFGAAEPQDPAMASMLCGDAYVCTINGEDVPIRNVRLGAPDAVDRSDNLATYRDGWEGSVTFTTTRRQPTRLWDESPKRAMARLLDAPTLLPEGPERQAEVRRARRRARNRDAACKGGMIRHGWTPLTPLEGFLIDQLEWRIRLGPLTDLIL